MSAAPSTLTPPVGPPRLGLHSVPRRWLSQQPPLPCGLPRPDLGDKRLAVPRNNLSSRERCPLGCPPSFWRWGRGRSRMSCGRSYTFWGGRGGRAPRTCPGYQSSLRLCPTFRAPRGLRQEAEPNKARRTLLSTPRGGRSQRPLGQVPCYPQTHRPRQAHSEPLPPVAPGSHF